MATIKDIAKLAGVSHGTVSNVLNHRGNVSVEKIRLVEQAARELGYQMNSQASKLRSGKSEIVCIIVPRIDTEIYAKLYAGIEKELRETGYSIVVLCSEGMPAEEEKVLKKAFSMNPSAVVLVGVMRKNKEPVPEGTLIIMVDRYISGFPNNSVFFSFDFEEAGQKLAEKCIYDGNRSVAILCENQRYTCDHSFVKGITDVLEVEGCYYEILEAPPAMKFNRAFDILHIADSYDAIISMSKEDIDDIKMAHTYDNKIQLPMLYSLMNRNFGFENSDMYEMDYKLMGKHIAELILKDEKEHRISGDLEIIREKGTLPRPKKYQRKQKDTIKLLTVKNSTSEAIKKLLPVFSNQSGINVNIIEVTYDELRKMVLSMEKEMDNVFDLVRIDIAWMNGLGKKIFRELNKENRIVKNIRNSIFPKIPKEYYLVDDELLAFPLDACVQMLFCRKDIFEDELTKRLFYEKKRRRLQIPQNYKEYDEIAEFFTCRYNKKSPTGYGTTLSYGRSYTAACDLLPRFYAIGGKAIDKNGRVIINSNEMRQALEDYLHSALYSTKKPNFWWREAAAVFSEGMIAMNVLFSNYAADMVHTLNSRVAGNIIYAEVPGGRPLLGGGSIGITKKTDKEAVCLKFLEWLYSDEIANMITYLGGFVGNKSIDNNAEILELYPWIEGIENMFQKGMRGENEDGVKFDEFIYEDILGSAIMSAASGISTVEEALILAQRKCDQLLNQYKD